MSALSEKGGQPMVGNLEFAATNPDSALDLPAMVMYTSLPASLFSSSIFKTFLRLFVG